MPHVTLKSIAQNPDIHEGMTRAEIDAAIARHAETETLFDRPYEDPKVVRVAGPFTVESLSPHRVVADGPEDLRRDEPRRSRRPGGSSADDPRQPAGLRRREPTKGERLDFATWSRTPALGAGGGRRTPRLSQARPSRSPSAPSSAPSAPS